LWMITTSSKASSCPSTSTLVRQNLTWRSMTAPSARRSTKLKFTYTRVSSCNLLIYLLFLL
jgi:hypothetical protein